jgi:hypothetical protein
VKHKIRLNPSIRVGRLPEIRGPDVDFSRDFAGGIVYQIEQATMNLKPAMNKRLPLIGILLATLAANAQQAAPPAVMPAPPQAPPAQAPGGSFNERLARLITKEESEDPSQTRFDLDFPGGTPAALVAAIQSAMKKPLNAIIPTEHASTFIPALKMSGVTVPQLFKALEQASAKSEAIVTSTSSGRTGPFNSSYQVYHTSFGFSTTDKNPNDNSVWYFRVEKPLAPPAFKSCRFYSLEPWLDRGLKVDDITTAIRTAWKMLDNGNTPEISFHQDTKLLIAVGEPDKLETIDAALKALTPPPQPVKTLPGIRPLPKPVEAQKTND